jgi:hypothetical protein
MRNVYKVFVGNPEMEENSGNLAVVRRIILEWMLGKYGGKVCTGLNWLRIRTSGGLM